MSNRYSPLPSPAGQEYTYRELLDLSRALEESREFVPFQVLSVAPARPQEGMVAHADGTNWNPGAGAGPYAYISGVWTPLFTGGAGSGANLSWNASTRTVASDTGTDAVITLVTSSDAGLAPASGGGTANFLRADATWAAPTATVADGDKGDITISSGVWNIDAATVGLTELSASATASASVFLRGDNKWSRIDTTEDVIIDLATKGLVLKDTQGTPHYWRVTINTSGALVTSDLGTTKP